MTLYQLPIVPTNLILLLLFNVDLNAFDGVNRQFAELEYYVDLGI